MRQMAGVVSLHMRESARSAAGAEGHVPRYRVLDGVYRSVEVNMKQTERILQYMRDFGSITQLEAIRDISCMRLGARIFDLKREGYEIKKETETSKNRYGEDTSYARYRLVDDEG